MLEGENIRDRLLLSHSTPARIKWGVFIYESCSTARNTSSAREDDPLLILGECGPLSCRSVKWYGHVVIFINCAANIFDM